MTSMRYDTGTFSLFECDECVVSGTRTQREFAKHLIVKHLATLGPCTALGGRNRGQDTEQDCEMGQNLHADRD